MELNFGEIKALVPRKFSLLTVARVLALEKGKKIAASSSLSQHWKGGGYEQ